jgi:3',5'-cyclic AMP phosphodiesterase CpdA
MLGKTPFYPVYGNHDAQNLNFREYFELPNNEYWYSFDYGSVHVIGLDSTSDHSPGSPQYQWLVADLEAAKEMPWKVVYFHYPPYSPTVEDNTYSVRDYLNPLFEKYGVNIVFNGHSHVYDHYFVNGVHYVVTGGGGGWTITHETSKYNAPFHYTRVTVSPEKLVVEAVKVGGQLADRFEVTK